MNWTYHVTPPPPEPTVDHYVVIDFEVFRPPVALGTDIGTLTYDGTHDACWYPAGERPTLDRGMFDTIVVMTDGTRYRARQADIERYLTDNGYNRQ